MRLCGWIALAVCVALLPRLGAGQTVSGRIVDAAGEPLPNLTVNLKTSGDLSSQGKTDDRGRFSVLVGRQRALTFSIVETVEIGEMSLALAGRGVDFGTMRLRFSRGARPNIEVLGPIHFGPASASGESIRLAYITGNCNVHIVHVNGHISKPPREKDAANCTAPKISADKHAAGWLVEYYACCSYPIPLQVAVYRPGRSVRIFHGGTGVWDWQFVHAGKYVVFYEALPHGERVPHFELRNVETNRTLGIWDGPLTAKAPAWTKGLRSE